MIFLFVPMFEESSGRLGLGTLRSSTTWGGTAVGAIVFRVFCGDLEETDGRELVIQKANEVVALLEGLLSDGE